MPRFSKRSRDQLDTIHSDLREVLEEAIKIVDFTVYEGYRSNAKQLEHFRNGKTQLGPGQSKHNLEPSEAADLWAYPIDWKDTDQQHFVAGVIIGISHMMGVPLRWGNDWDRDGDVRDNRFDDLPHFELV